MTFTVFRRNDGIVTIGPVRGKIRWYLDKPLLRRTGTFIVWVNDQPYASIPNATGFRVHEATP